MRCTRKAIAKDKNIISRLRIREFGRSKDFDLLLADKLKWNRLDAEQTVVAVWRGKVPLSTMRAVVVNDAISAQNTLQCSVSDHVAYPAIVFNAAATRKENRGEGLNQVIRYHFLAAAIHQGIEALLSPIYFGAPRMDFMAALGYHFIKPRKCWQTKLLPKSERILGILPRAKMRYALKYLFRHRGEAINRYPWKGPSMKLPIQIKPRVIMAAMGKNSN